ncbi:hypothetical protein EVG20_g11384, partial [Dentipellis fragilis]
HFPLSSQPRTVAIAPQPHAASFASAYDATPPPTPPPTSLVSIPLRSRSSPRDDHSTLAPYLQHRNSRHTTHGSRLTAHEPIYQHGAAPQALRKEKEARRDVGALVSKTLVYSCTVAVVVIK